MIGSENIGTLQFAEEDSIETQIKGVNSSPESLKPDEVSEEEQQETF